MGKDLFESELVSPNDEILEELVILITEDSLSVIWMLFDIYLIFDYDSSIFISHEMKILLSPLIYYIPNLVEYISSTEDESDIDLFQARKVCEFKRMMLQTIKKQDSIGITVPISYDDILVQCFFINLFLFVYLGYRKLAIITIFCY